MLFNLSEVNLSLAEILGDKERKLSYDLIYPDNDGDEYQNQKWNQDIAPHKKIGQKPLPVKQNPAQSWINEQGQKADKPNPQNVRFSAE